MANKDRTFLCLFVRGDKSAGPSRQQLGPAAFHWSILIAPKVQSLRDCTAFDVSDGNRLSAGGNNTIINVGQEWYFRTRLVDPTRSLSMLAQIMVGKVPKGVTREAIGRALEAISIPSKHANPEENCVSWTIEALVTLQAMGAVESTIDMHALEEYALTQADERLRVGVAKEIKSNFTNRKM